MEIMEEMEMVAIMVILETTVVPLALRQSHLRVMNVLMPVSAEQTKALAKLVVQMAAQTVRKIVQETRFKIVAMHVMTIGTTQIHQIIWVAKEVVSIQVETNVGMHV